MEQTTFSSTEDEDENIDDQQEQLTEHTLAIKLIKNNRYKIVRTTHTVYFNIDGVWKCESDVKNISKTFYNNMIANCDLKLDRKLIRDQTKRWAQIRE